MDIINHKYKKVKVYKRVQDRRVNFQSERQLSPFEKLAIVGKKILKAVTQ